MASDTPHLSSAQQQRLDRIGSQVCSWRNRHRQAIEAWVILTPILIYQVIFFILPIIGNLYISFTEWGGMGKPIWVGLENYRRYFTGSYVKIWYNTAIFAVFILVLQTTIGFFLALLLNQKVIGLPIYRTLFYAPTLTSAAITGSVLLVFLGSYDGVLNMILKSMGLKEIVWLWDTTWMRVFIILYSTWRGIGGPMVLFLAALQGIHREIYEAAMVDGATGWDLIRFITVPLLRPMLIYVVITGMVGTFQVFDAIRVTTNGGPAGTTNVVMLQIYNDAWGSGKLGLAAAGAVALALVLLGLTITQMRMMSRAGDVEAG